MSQMYQGVNHLENSVKSGYSQVLVIHGKGYHSDGGIAVLKDMVECYVRLEGREYIKNMIEAPKEHGGSGAKIFFLKH